MYYDTNDTNDTDSRCGRWALRSPICIYVNQWKSALLFWDFLEESPLIFIRQVELCVRLLAHHVALQC